MTRVPDDNEIKAISHHSTNEKVFELAKQYLKPGARIVDVGAGEGFFSQMIGEYVRTTLSEEPASVISACDIFPEYYKYAMVPCDRISPDGRLPYDDASFDIACSLEVVEHVQDQFMFARELHRILRPGGIALISTPNVLNLNSRVRYLHSGFTVLFDPLLLSSNDPVHTSGHINPISCYYLLYQLSRAGFSKQSVHYDRFKRSAAFLVVVWGWFVTPANLLFRKKIRRRKPDVDRENRAILDDLNSFSMLTSRSIIIRAVK